MAQQVIRMVRDLFMRMVRETQAGSTIHELKVYLDDAITRAQEEADKTFFMVHPADTDELVAAMDILSYYQVVASFTADHESDLPATSLAIRVMPGSRYGDFRLAEMAFQAAFHQKSHYACDVCASNGETSCGHLTFGRLIKPAF